MGRYEDTKMEIDKPDKPEKLNKRDKPEKLKRPDKLINQNVASSFNWTKKEVRTTTRVVPTENFGL